MRRLVEYELENGGSVIVEVDELAGVDLAGLRDAVEKASEKFEEALRRIKPVTMAILTTVKELGDSPDNTSVEFGVKLGTKAGIVVASANTEVNFVFKLT